MLIFPSRFLNIPGSDAILYMAVQPFESTSHTWQACKDVAASLFCAASCTCFRGSFACNAMPWLRWDCPCQRLHRLAVNLLVSSYLSRRSIVMTVARESCPVVGVLVCEEFDQLSVFSHLRGGRGNRAAGRRSPRADQA